MSESVVPVVPDLDALRALAEKAIPGPWIVIDGTSVATKRKLSAAAHGLVADAQVEEDADFIAACSPNTILALLDYVASLQRRVPTPDEVEAVDRVARFIEEAGWYEGALLDAHALRALVSRNTSEEVARAAPADASRLPSDQDGQR